MGIKYSVDENFFEKWDKDMSYVLGFIYADGNLENSPSVRGKYLRVSSMDKNAIEKIKKALKSQHNIVATENPLNGKEQYLIRIGSHKIYNDLTKIGLFPNKSLTIRMPEIPEKYLAHFIRGYFDGDGCVYLETTKGKKKMDIIKRLSTIFTSGSKNFLNDLEILLNKRSLGKKKIYDSHNSFQLRCSTKDSIKLFLLMYDKIKSDLYFKRKYLIFNNYFKKRPIRVDKDVLNVLRCLSVGHVVK